MIRIFAICMGALVAVGLATSAAQAKEAREGVKINSFWGFFGANIEAACLVVDAGILPADRTARGKVLDELKVKCREHTRGVLRKATMKGGKPWPGSQIKQAEKAAHLVENYIINSLMTLPNLQLEVRDRVKVMSRQSQDIETQLFPTTGNLNLGPLPIYLYVVCDANSST